MEPEIKKEGQRIEVFDGIRGLASLIVMFFHLCVWSVNGYKANTYREFVSPYWEVMTNTPLKIFWGGNEAVLVFYIIGGFVLAKPYLKGRELAFLPFIIRRWIRVMLPYLIILTVSYLLVYLFGNLKAAIALSGSFNVKWSRLPNPLEMLLYYLGYDYHLNIVAGAFWSMVQEWRVSFIIPFVGVALHRYKTKWVVGSLVALQLGLDALSGWGMESEAGWLGQLSESFNRTNYYVIYFIIGAVLAKHIDAVRAFVREQRAFRIASALAIPFLLPSSWLLAAIGFTFKVRNELFLTGLGIVLFLLLCMESPRLTAFFKSRPLLFLGKLSFSLYLTHTTMIVLFVTLAGQVIPAEIALFLSPAFAILMATIWQRFVESKCLDLVKHLKN